MPELKCLARHLKQKEIRKSNTRFEEHLSVVFCKKKPTVNKL